MKPKSLHDFVGAFRQAAGDHINYQQCPECGDQRYKVYLNVESGYWFCFAGEHNAGGRVDVGGQDGDALLRSLRGETPARHAWKPIDPPANLRPAPQAAYDYMKKRGALPWSEWVFGNYIYIPYYNAASELIYYTGRDYTGTEKRKYMAAPGRKPLWINLPRSPIESRANDVVLVEGVFDAWAVANAGFMAAGIGGKHLPAYMRQELLDMRPRRVIIFLDSDALAAALRISRELQAFVETVIVVPPRGKDPADLMWAEINNLIRGVE